MTVGHRITRLLIGMATIGLVAVVNAPATTAAPAPTAQVAAASAGAPGWLTPTTLRACTNAQVAADSWAGVTHGFMSCRRGSSKVVLYFRISTSGAVTIIETPWTGYLLAASYDRGHNLYAIGNLNNVGLGAARFDEATGTASPVTLLSSEESTDADIVARNGKWWAVWSQITNGDNELYQRRTLFGVQPTTMITTNSEDDFEPTIDVDGRTATMIWRKGGPANAYTDLRIATSTNGAWSSSLFTAGGTDNYNPDLRTFNGAKYVVWNRDSSTHYSENLGGGFRTTTIGPGGLYKPKVLGGSRKALIWYMGSATYYGEYSSGSWNTGTVPIGSEYPRAIAQVGTRPAVVYSTSTAVRLIKRSS